jgi:hypothetical protein
VNVAREVPEVGLTGHATPADDRASGRPSVDTIPRRKAVVPRTALPRTLVEARLRDPEFCERHAEAYDPASVER